jgi:integrative and conjugative element protein (TIGR02256 family)
VREEIVMREHHGGLDATGTHKDTRSVLVLGPTLRAEVTHEANRAFPNETGGVLMGYWWHASLEDPLGGCVVVAAVIGPGPLAIHKPRSFSPDHEYQEREVGRVYQASGRMSTYLGDWHTHPNGTGLLSRRDERTAIRIASAPRARAPRPVMLVLAGGDPWVPHAWVANVVLSERWKPQLIMRHLTVRTTGSSLGLLKNLAE